MSDLVEMAVCFLFTQSEYIIMIERHQYLLIIIELQPTAQECTCV